MKTFKKALLFSVGLLLITCKQSGSEGFTLKGKINDAFSGYIFLEYNDIIDSALVIDNAYTFKGVVAQPTEGILSAAHPHANAPMTFSVFMLENSNITITTKYQLANSNGTQVRFLDIDSITGSQSHVLKTNFDSILRETLLLSVEDSVKEQLLFEKLSVFLESNPQSILSAKYLLNLTDYHGYFDDNQITHLIAVMDTSYQEKEDISKLKRIIQQRKSLKVGSVAPPVTLPTAEGSLIESEKLRGTYLLLEFWASWCAPCRQKNPELLNIYHTYHENGFETLGISIDTDMSRWQTAIQEDRLDWLNAIDTTRSTQSMYHYATIPFNVLLNKEGRIVAKNIHPKELAEILRKEL